MSQNVNTFQYKEKDSSVIKYREVMVPLEGAVTGVPEMTNTIVSLAELVNTLISENYTSYEWYDDACRIIEMSNDLSQDLKDISINLVKDINELMESIKGEDRRVRLSIESRQRELGDILANLEGIDSKKVSNPNKPAEPTAQEETPTEETETPTEEETPVEETPVEETETPVEETQPSEESNYDGEQRDMDEIKDAVDDFGGNNGHDIYKDAEKSGNEEIYKKNINNLLDNLNGVQNQFESDGKGYSFQSTVFSGGEHANGDGSPTHGMGAKADLRWYKDGVQLDVHNATQEDWEYIQSVLDNNNLGVQFEKKNTVWGDVFLKEALNRNGETVSYDGSSWGDDTSIYYVN